MQRAPVPWRVAGLVVAAVATRGADVWLVVGHVHLTVLAERFDRSCEVGAKRIASLWPLERSNCGTNSSRTALTAFVLKTVTSAACTRPPTASASAKLSIAIFILCSPGFVLVGGSCQDAPGDMGRLDIMALYR